MQNQKELTANYYLGHKKHVQDIMCINFFFFFPLNSLKMSPVHKLTEHGNSNTGGW